MRFLSRYTRGATARADLQAQTNHGRSFWALLLAVGALAGGGLLVWAFSSPSPLMSGPIPTPTPTPSTLVRIVPPAQTIGFGSTITVAVEVQQVSDLGAYEFHLRFDSSVLAFETVTDDTFLRSTGRIPLCVPVDSEDLQASIVSYACGSFGAEGTGPSGSGVLARVTFTTSCLGASDLDFVPLVGLDLLPPPGADFFVEPVSLRNTLADLAVQDIPTRTEDGSVTVTGGLPCPTPTPTSTPLATSTPAPTATPAATATEGPSPTATQTGDPLATPTHTPTATPTSPNASPPPPPPEVTLGDVTGDGAVNSVDALWLLWYLAALLDTVPSPESMDVNVDGDANVVDAALILQLDAGLLHNLPPDASAAGESPRQGASVAARAQSRTKFSRVHKEA